GAGTRHVVTLSTRRAEDGIAPAPAPSTPAPAATFARPLASGNDQPALDQFDRVTPGGPVRVSSK
ncbi:MAG TPA: hypothetical protein VG186_10950, partial [Solirubrobacteraceae bacterium]|nr:hypothetical protein [Solirubrobacteraceae bacterium]